MAVVCPYCDQRLHFRAMPPGDYQPQCPRCFRPFLLMVPTAAAAPWRVRAVHHDVYTDIDTNHDHACPEAPATQVRIRSANPSAAALARTNPDLRHSIPALRPTARIGKPTPPSARVDAPAPDAQNSPAPPPSDIRGYRVEKEIGRGGMGSVYLARQLSLGRHVALKIMSQEWAADPVFVARFTREAYAAAQLSHPNIVRIFDIGETEGTPFFSMEYVPGESLAELVKRQGKLDPETAVGYVLQAARGLKHAHDRGMIHRDVKPDNLLLDDQGVVKVADLGLVKTWNVSHAECGVRSAEFQQENAAPASAPPSALRSPNSALTGARIALGTPAYMSPEQCRDAATVDHRADIYSLGCTLYVLVTGRPPFDGHTAVELMTKQAYEPIVPPEQIVARVPKEVSAIIQKMMAKDAADRYADMGEVVRTLESWLGVWHMGTFTPRENQIGRIEEFATRFNASAAVLLRGRAIGGFFALIALAVVLLTFFGQFVWAFGLVGLGVQTTLAYFVLDGIARRAHLFNRTKQFVWGLCWGDWIVGLTAFALFFVLLAMLNVLWVWCGFGLIGVGVAIGLHFGLDRTIELERGGPIRACERMMVRMRMQGLSEDELRLFVAKFAGRRWEEFFEVLFGYEAKLATRAIITRGESAGPREKFAAWREPILNAMDRIEKSRRDARERELFRTVEQANWMAAGLGRDAALRKAEAAAATMVRRANRVRTTDDSPARAEVVTHSPVNLQRLLSGAEASAADLRVEEAGWRPFHWLAWLTIGPPVRLALALALFTLSGLWAYQNGILNGANFAGHTMPLVITGIPAEATTWVDCGTIGAAGLLLLASLFFGGFTSAAFALFGAAVVIFGPRCGIRPAEPFQDFHIALMLGFMFALLGFRFGPR